MREEQHQTPVDRLSFKLKIETKPIFKNVTKHKRVRATSVIWKFHLSINDTVLDADEVFVVDAFFDSLLVPRKYPMFTCTCGVFGCGGYYVDVAHADKTVRWHMEQSPLSNRDIDCSSHEFHFSWETIILFSNDLIRELEKLDHLLQMHEAGSPFNIEAYKRILDRVIAHRQQ